jgi:meiotically up-regulated gene 157 (Mug157) protein
MRANLSGVIRPWDDDSVFVVTGDIPAMWLRDSSTQLRPYLLLCRDDPALQDVLVGVLRSQVRFLLSDPYANSFRGFETSWHAADRTEAGTQTWERKFELDSLCFPIELADRLWRIAGRSDVFDAGFHRMCEVIVDTMTTEQHHDQASSYFFERLDGPTSDTLIRGGRGSATEPCGLVWSAFRPSDDACQLGFNIPGNMFAAAVLQQLTTILDNFYPGDRLRERVTRLRSEIVAGIEEHGTLKMDGVDVYAYEVDGRGAAIMMDDANMPSLLSAPLSGYLSSDDPRYRATRAVILSSQNPYFFTGGHARGMGSPHTPHNYVWPIGVAVEALTSRSESRKLELLEMLMRCDGGTGRMHESFDPDNPNHYTREWFSWADAMFSELILDLIRIRHDSYSLEDS